MQKFIQSLQAKEKLRRVQRDLKREAETKLKLIKAQVEFLNFAIEARKKLGLTFKPNPYVSELLRMTEEDQRIRIKEKFTLSLNRSNENVFTEMSTQKGVYSKAKLPKKFGFIRNSKTKD